MNVMTPQEKWQAKAGLISKSYKLPKIVVDDFAETCKIVGVTQGRQLREMMIDFINFNKEEEGSIL